MHCRRTQTCRWPRTSSSWVQKLSNFVSFVFFPFMCTWNEHLCCVQWGVLFVVLGCLHAVCSAYSSNDELLVLSRFVVKPFVVFSLTIVLLRMQAWFVLLSVPVLFDRSWPREWLCLWAARKCSNDWRCRDETVNQTFSTVSRRCFFHFILYRFVTWCLHTERCGSFVGMFSFGLKVIEVSFCQNKWSKKSHTQNCWFHRVFESQARADCSQAFTASSTNLSNRGPFFRSCLISTRPHVVKILQTTCFPKFARSFFAFSMFVLLRSARLCLWNDHNVDH